VSLRAWEGSLISWLNLRKKNSSKNTEVVQELKPLSLFLSLPTGSCLLDVHFITSMK